MTLVTQTEIQSDQKCFHCGAACNQGIVYYKEQSFCCNGCKTVFEILEHSDMECYYSIDTQPGIKPNYFAETFEFLELPEVQEQLIYYKDDDLIKIKLKIPQIHCSSCIYLLENLHKINNMIHSCRVNFQTKTIQLTITNLPDALKRTFSLLNQLGYTPQIIENTNSPSLRTSRSLLVKIGVAGFCFGNIMLLSFPEYISGGSEIDQQFKNVFKFLIVILILPVLFYAAREYFTTAFKQLRKKYLGVDVPIVLGMSALFLRSLYEMFVLNEPGYLDSLSGFVFFLLIGKWFQSQTYEHLSFDKHFQSFFPLAVLKRIGQSFKISRVKDLVKGDTIKLRYNEILPVNARLIDDNASFDYSFVTGESKVIDRKAGSDLFAGGKLVSASATFEVNDEMDAAYLNDIWQSQDSKSDSQLSVFIDKISQHFTMAVIVIALSGMVLWYFLAGASKSIEVFTSILIVACPCALALAAPFVYGNASRLLGRINVFFKDTSLVEKISKITHIVFDKTGTLTQKDEVNITYEGAPLNNALKEALAVITANSIHPLSRSLANYLRTEQIDKHKATKYEEVPGLGIAATYGDDIYHIGSAKWMHQHRINYTSHQQSIGSIVYVAKDHQFIGCFFFSNKYRKQILDRVAELNTDQYDISILSGDGDQERAYLNKIFDNKIALYFHQDPAHKEQYIQELTRETEGSVMMLGDGINDALALKASDIGIAITEDTGSFTPNSDIIMHASAISKLPEMLQFSKDSQRVLFFCLWISVIYNLVGLGFAFAGVLSPLIAAILMPVSSITVVVVAVGLTNFFARKNQIL